MQPDGLLGLFCVSHNPDCTVQTRSVQLTWDWKTLTIKTLQTLNLIKLTVSLEHLKGSLELNSDCYNDVTDTSCILEYCTCPDS